MTAFEYIETMARDGLVHVGWTYLFASIIVGAIAIIVFLFNKTKKTNDIYGPKIVKVTNKLYDISLTDPDEAIALLDAKATLSMERPDHLKVMIPGIAATLNNPRVTREDGCWAPLISIVRRCAANLDDVSREKLSLEQDVRSLTGTIDSQKRHITKLDEGLEAANVTIAQLRLEIVKTTQEVVNVERVRGEPAALALANAKHEGYRERIAETATVTPSVTPVPA